MNEYRVDELEEIWKDIEDFHGYQVSNIGRVRSWLNNRHGIGVSSHILVQCVDKETGYLKVNLQRDKRGHTKAVHVLVAEAFCGGKHPGHDVNHEDGNKLNNIYTNLTWVTRGDNIRHAFKHGLKMPSKPNQKAIRIIETGEIFNSISDCARAIGGRPHTICMCLDDKYNRSAHKGLHFEYVDEDRRTVECQNSEIKPFLYPHQKEAVEKMFDGCILNGGVGSGKSITGLYYYFQSYGGRKDDIHDYVYMKNPPDLYIITTAKKRNDNEWSGDMAPFLLSTNPEVSPYKHKVIVDSWQNIKKYVDVHGAFFIFDEDHVTGNGAWVKAFLKIAKLNRWIILSASPGDKWEDYIPVFIANGFYKNKTQFSREHLIYSRYSKFPKVERYVNEGRLIRLRNKILIDMDFKRHTIPHHEDVYVRYDVAKYKDAMRNRWDPYKNEPIQQASGLCYVLRRIVNTDEARQVALLELFEKHPKMIVFYNFDHERDILLNLYYGEDVEVAEYSGHAHQPVPDSESWVYLVNYTAGCEGFNCIKTNTIVFYSQNYSYKTMIQAAGRIDRLNSPFIDLYYYHLKSRSGIDLAISKALSQKKNFNEGRYVEQNMKW